ncbi:MAG TPA: hypothetical protein VJ023_06480 [Pyrinomonadaceae bacterium]|nr:hypothetical protein [Pyrinomonadaceae bacterium]
MTDDTKEHGAFLRSIARESYEELVEFASQQMGQLKERDAVGLRTAAITLVSEITSEVAAETAAETAAEAAAQMAVELRHQSA